MKILFHIAVLTAVPFMAGAQAQPYPTRQITMIVPSAAGGPTDTIGRVLAERMRESLGQAVIVENVTGAGGNIGVGRVARAAPDGHTLVLGHWSTHVVNGAIYALPYDVVKDFDPIAPISTNPQIILSSNTVPAKDLRGLIAWLKSNPGKATLATVGAGSQPHVAGILFQKITGTNFRFVPYRGAAPGMRDLLAGQIDLMIPQVLIALPQVQAGKIRAYAVTAKTRQAVAPNVPTVDEAGAPGLYISSWHGLWAPKNTPRDVIAKLNVAVVDTLADPIVRQKLAGLGQELWPREQQTTATLAAFQRAEIDKWWPIVKEAGIKPE